MEEIPLSHLSRPQLVNLLSRIVDLLSQPVQLAQHTQTCPPLEPYDASVDPWNAPDMAQPANFTGQGGSGPVTTGDTTYPPGLLGASATYPVVSGPCGSSSHVGSCEPSPEPAPGLPRFGSFPQSELVSFTSACPSGVNTSEERGLITGVSMPCENALPGCGPWRFVCNCKCDICGTPCVLQRAGHSIHRCTIHKLP